MKSRAPSGVGLKRIGVWMSRKPALLHDAPDDRHHLRPQPDVSLQLVAPQVEPAVAQAQRLVDALLVELEREWRRGGHDFERVHAKLNLPGRQVRVHEFRGAGDDLALGAQHELVAHVMRDLRRRGRVLGVDHELAQTRSVAEVDEDKAAVIPPAMRPAGEREPLPHVLGPHVTAHQVPPRHGRRPSTTAARSVPASTTTTSRAASRFACVS